MPFDKVFLPVRLDFSLGAAGHRMHNGLLYVAFGRLRNPDQ
jgi:hypothetical protein